MSHDECNGGYADEYSDILRGNEFQAEVRV